MENNKKEARLVFNPGCARALLRDGCVMIDIKQSRENADKSVFVFRNDEKFQTAFEKLNKEIAESKAQCDE